MEEGKIQIHRKIKLPGEDGYKTLLVRIKEETVVTLDKTAGESSRSRNKVINIFFEHGIQNCEGMKSEM